MTLFRLFLAILVLAVVAYTVVVVMNHGLNLFPDFIGDVMAMGWPGQFNVDFLSFLMLGGLWLAWRHSFSAAGIALGLFIFAGGMPFFASYLLVQSLRTRGDMAALLLGENRAVQLKSK